MREGGNREERRSIYLCNIRVLANKWTWPNNVKGVVNKKAGQYCKKNVDSLA